MTKTMKLAGLAVVAVLLGAQAWAIAENAGTFDGQVQKISQTVSGAALQTRAALAASQTRAIPAAAGMAGFLAENMGKILSQTEVEGIVVTQYKYVYNPDWNIVVIVVKPTTKLDVLYKRLVKQIPDLDNYPVEYKLPGQKPIARLDDVWIEDTGVDFKY